jgi:hypothetical protein
MWYLDVPQHDPDSNYAEASSEQTLYAEEGRDALAQLKGTLEKLTVPLRRAFLNEIRDALVGGVYRKMPSHVMPDGSSYERPYDPGKSVA